MIVLGIDKQVVFGGEWALGHWVAGVARISHTAKVFLISVGLVADFSARLRSRWVSSHLEGRAGRFFDLESVKKIINLLFKAHRLRSWS